MCFEKFPHKYTTTEKKAILCYTTTEYTTTIYEDCEHNNKKNIIEKNTSHTFQFSLNYLNES